QFAKCMGLSRSELYCMALQEYLKVHKREEITKQLDAVYTEEDSSIGPFFVQLQAQTLSEETW
ncbi:ChpI protein, partial [Aetokthonos hydrillicola]